ncbi:MAG: hypothetical protein SRB2_04488 [Desulfobacteraceae bacterium Eth-SRB2]|nr:MAG: hypothetical protein SRB2_04488 [Desulfobacteraceae bacterium Eth-SRB2]
MNTKNFLKTLNEDLRSLDMLLETDVEERYLNIFVLGLPRSGTTLITQVIFSSLNVMCTNHLIARFWKAPLVGAFLSKLVFGSLKETLFSSTYAKTSFPWEPHEFSWFWHDIMNISVLDQKPIKIDINKIDWNKVRRKICNLNQILESNLVHKPLELVGYHLEHFSSMFEKAVFVYIERDQLDVAYSLAEARLNHFNDLNVWWSSYPPASQFMKIRNSPYNVQIAGQVKFLADMYEQKISHLQENQLVRISYKALCDDPVSLLNELVNKANRLGCNLRVLDIPGKFEVARKERDAELLKDLIDGFDEIGGISYE